MLNSEYNRIYSPEMDSCHLEGHHILWVGTPHPSDRWVVGTIFGPKKVQDCKQNCWLGVLGSVEYPREVPDNLMAAPDSEGCLGEVQDIENFHLQVVQSPHWVDHLYELAGQMPSHQYQLPHYPPRSKQYYQR